MIERLLLHAINNFKDLVKKKKKLYVTKFYIFRLEINLQFFTCKASMFNSSRTTNKKE